MKFKLIYAREHHVPVEEIYLLFLDVCNAVILEVAACKTEVNHINIGGLKDITICLRKLFYIGLKV